jgi:hypothetical protein
MNELRPEIAPLAAAATDADRAAALIRMSDSALMTCESTIRNRLQVAGFRAGLDYLDAALAVVRAPRDSAGCSPSDLIEAWNGWRGALFTIAAGGQG